jgi:dihydroorotase
MTSKPAELFGLPWGVLEIGRAADLTLVDLETEKAVEPAQFLSKGRNTPFAGWKLYGWPSLTMVAGKTVWSE